MLSMLMILEMALVENIQREDLNPIEVALSYQRLIDECSLTQDQLSQKISKSRSSITNHIRLLKLPADIQAGLKDRKLSMGHARALVSAGDEALQLELFKRIVAENLSVRDLEAIIRGEKIANKKEETQKNPKSEISEDEYTFKEHLGDRLNTKVNIKKSGNGGGSIVVKFSSESDLNRIMELLKK